MGRALVATAIDVAEREGLSEVRLCTMPFMGRARRLYERFNFVSDDDRVGDLYGTATLGMALQLDTADP